MGLVKERIHFDDQSWAKLVTSLADRESARLKMKGRGGHHYATFPSITAPLWKPVMTEIPNVTCVTMKKSRGESGRFAVQQEEEVEEEERKKAPVGKKKA